MKAVLMRNNQLFYYNTSTAKHICCTWDTEQNIIKELHLTKTGLFFFATYDEGKDKHYISHATVKQTLDFIEDNKKRLKWFPGGQTILEDGINNYDHIQDDSDQKPDDTKDVKDI